MHSVETERTRLLVQLERLLELPMIVLSMVWVAIAVVELTHGLSRAGELVSLSIWAIFIADFVLKLAVAPRKTRFLRRNVITVLSLLLPALRVFRAIRMLRVLRVLRGMRLASLLSSVNRGLRALRRGFRRRGGAYVVAATVLVLFTGAAGIMAFEVDGPAAEAFDSYARALWWTAMLMTTIGSDAWPRTGAGRVLTLFLSLYSIGVFGYLTAMLASLFVDREAEERAQRERKAAK